MSDELREGWRSVAAGWERRRDAMWEMTQPVSKRLVELLAPEPGETLLELAAGSGDTGYLATERIGPEGRLITSDFVPEIVDSARRRAATLALENVEFQVLDAQALDLPDTSVDGVLCRWGYMLTDDPARALAETRRVLRPGGRVSFTVWGSAPENPWASTAGRVLVGRGLAEPPDPDAPGPFRLGDRARVDELVASAGLELAVHEDFPVAFRYASFDDYWETSRDLSHTLKRALDALGDDEIAGVRTELSQALGGTPSGDPLELSGITQIVLARRAA